MDLNTCFEDFCKENELQIAFSDQMPEGFETANGTFDPAADTLFFNTGMLAGLPEYEQLFYLFHELRHALQYCRPDLFSETINRSKDYVIAYDGTCYLRDGEEWLECRIDGTPEFLQSAYLGQPYEADANTFAYETVKRICGDLPELHRLFSFWMPEHRLTDAQYDSLYREIRERAQR